MSAPDANHDEAAPTGGAGEVFFAFLSLGLRSFGGPIAHLGYFRRAFVDERRWLDDARYTQLLALCQFLPGPASSQLGFSIGLMRAGWRGAIAAFVGFTLPSALLMFAFAWWTPYLQTAWGRSLLHGLKLVAVVVVAQAVHSMWRSLAPDGPRRVLAAVAAAFLLWQPENGMQLLVLAAAALLSPWVCRHVRAQGESSLDPGYGTRAGTVLLIIYALLLLAAFTVAWDGGALLGTGAAFYRAGALVFGGGHVVLPWLKQALVEPGLIDENTFLAGYGAAQAVPGPMFSLAAFLGDHMVDRAGWAGALVALVAVSLARRRHAVLAKPFDTRACCTDHGCDQRGGRRPARGRVLQSRMDRHGARCVRHPHRSLRIRDARRGATARMGRGVVVRGGDRRGYMAGSLNTRY